MSGHVALMPGHQDRLDVWEVFVERRSADGQISVGALPRRTPPRRAANLSLEAVAESADFLSRVSETAALSVSGGKVLYVFHSERGVMQATFGEFGQT